VKLLFAFLIAALPVASVAQSQSGAASGVPSVAIPKTTEVLIIQTAKQGVTPQQIMAIMPAEIRATVKLYFDGKIRQWYSQLMDHEYVPVGPLMPLRALMSPRVSASEDSKLMSPRISASEDSKLMSPGAQR